HTAEHAVTAAAERTYRGGRVFTVSWFAVDLVPERDDRVDAQERFSVASGLRATGNGGGFAVGVLQHQVLRMPRGQLLDIGNDDLERDPELLEDRAPLGRTGGEDQNSAVQALGERSRSHGRPTQERRSRAPCWCRSRSRSRRGSSRGPTAVGWWRRSPGARPRSRNRPRAPSRPAERRG